MRRLLIAAMVVLALAGAAVVAAAILFVRSGFSARPEPSRLETSLARTMRDLAGRPLRGLQNPVPDTRQIIAEGRAHFADHCAQCHANDGSGQTEMGRLLYPRAPDMRLPATQSLTDGELFGIIENGVRLTGMPAWGDGSEQSHAATWKLVRFIRHLPALSDAEKAEMERLNPKGPDEWREQEEEEQFLDADAAKKNAGSHHH